MRARCSSTTRVWSSRVLEYEVRVDIAIFAIWHIYDVPAQCTRVLQVLNSIAILQRTRVRTRVHVAATYSVPYSSIAIHVYGSMVHWGTLCTPYVLSISILHYDEWNAPSINQLPQSTPYRCAILQYYWIAYCTILIEINHPFVISQQRTYSSTRVLYQIAARSALCKQCW